MKKAQQTFFTRILLLAVFASFAWIGQANRTGMLLRSNLLIPFRAQRTTFITLVRMGSLTKVEPGQHRLQYRHHQGEMHPLHWFPGP